MPPSKPFENNALIKLIEYRFTNEEKIKFHEDWLDWNIAATNWLEQVQSDFVKEIIIQEHPDRFAREMVVYLPLEMVGESKDTLTPIFLRKSD